MFSIAVFRLYFVKYIFFCWICMFVYLAVFWGGMYSVLPVCGPHPLWQQNHLRLIVIADITCDLGGCAMPLHPRSLRIPGSGVPCVVILCVCVCGFVPWARECHPSPVEVAPWACTRHHMGMGCCLMDPEGSVFVRGRRAIRNAVEKLDRSARRFSHL